MQWLTPAEPAELHCSVSQIKQFVMCPRKYAYRHVFSAPPEHRSVQLVLGSAVHEALAAHYGILGAGHQPEQEEVIAVYATAFRRMLAVGPRLLLDEGETVQEVEDEGLRLVRAFLAGVQAPDKVLAVEQPFHCDVTDPDSGEILQEQLVGFLDAVVEDQGAVVVLEHKTAARAWSQDQLDYDLQVGLYLAATGAEKVRLQVMTKTKQAKLLVHDLVRSVREQREAVQIVCRVLDAIRAGAFWPAPGWACKDCEYRVRCRG